MFLHRLAALWPAPRDRRAITQEVLLVFRRASLLALAAAPLAAQEATQPPAAAPAAELCATRLPAAKPIMRPGSSDTVTYWYGTNYRTPFVLRTGTNKASNIQRHALEITHLQFWSKGSNFADLMVSGGLWYWHNEYGKPSSDPGAKQTTPMVGITFHLDGNRAHRSE